MNSKSFKSPGLLVNGNSLLISLPGLFSTNRMLNIPVLLAFAFEREKKRITISAIEEKEKRSCVINRHH